MLRDEPPAKGVHGDHAAAQAAGGVDALDAVGEVDGAIAEGKAFDLGVVGDELRDLGAVHVRGDAHVADETFRLGLQGFGQGAAVDPGFPVRRIHDAPEMEERDLRQPEAGQGFFEAAAEFGA